MRSSLLREGKLYLSLMADAGIYVWEPDAAVPSTGAAVPAAPDEGGPRKWNVTRPLNLRESRSTGSAVVALLEPGRILDNMGCAAAEGRVWCYVQPLGGGPVGFVMSEFIEPAVSPNGAVMTGPDDSAYRAGQWDFDARGRSAAPKRRVSR